MPVPSEPEANDDDELARFVTMLGELGHPSPGQGIAARASDIARFIAIAGHPLPRSYVAFVERFGEQAPVFIAIGDGRGSLSEVLRFYDEEREGIDAQEVVIAAPSITEATVLRYTSDGRPPSVGHPGGPIAAPTFTHHLYRQGWVQTLRGAEVQLTVKAGDAASLAGLAEAAGFHRLWFSGGEGMCLEVPRTQLFIRAEHSCVRLFVLSRVPAERERWAAWFERKAGARRLAA